MKSVGITKYEALWQITRVSVKGPHISLEKKLERVRSYFEETNTFDRWERCYNWLEGLGRGYKACMNLYALDLISLEKTQYNANIPDKLSRSITSDIDELSRADHRLIKMLWTDLFRSNINWMNGGYLHKECNDFMDRLLIFIQSNNIFIKESQIMDLEIKRKQTIFKINKHKFIC